nr:hypothetical protein GCM10017745_47390 [Saccharothrix mutabilis subsp. capreolus]
MKAMPPSQQNHRVASRTLATLAAGHTGSGCPGKPGGLLSDPTKCPRMRRDYVTSRGTYTLSCHPHTLRSRRAAGRSTRA